MKGSPNGSPQSNFTRACSGNKGSLRHRWTSLYTNSEVKYAL